MFLASEFARLPAVAMVVALALLGASRVAVAVSAKGTLSVEFGSALAVCELAVGAGGDCWSCCCWYWCG